MYSIDVFGAFDFLENEIKIGTLSYERTRGSSAYRFAFEPGYFNKYGNLLLSHDIGYFLGVQAKSKGIFACFGDAMPDRWGKALIDKRERILAKEKNMIPRVFDDFGYLIRVDDFSRMGAFRFKNNGRYVGESNDGMPVPPVAKLEEFIRMSQEFERAEMNGSPLQYRMIYDIWKQGSSLGGARPKLTVIDDDEDLCLAKIPSVKDTYDMALWEHFTLTLAEKAGIRTARTRLVETSNTDYHTLLSKRFDRKGKKRIHYASSITLSGLKDGDGADTGKGYSDIMEAIISNETGPSVQNDLNEMYRRISFNIMAGNHDDHFRNHGFLLQNGSWVLSPAFDINPTNALTQSLLVTRNSNESSLINLLHSHDELFVRKNDAIDIVEQVVETFRGWKQHAKDIGMTNNESERFAERFNHSIEDGLDAIRQIKPIHQVPSLNGKGKNWPKSKINNE